MGATAVGTALLPQTLAGNPDSSKPPKGKKSAEYTVPQGADVSNAPHNEKYWGAVASNFIRPKGFINLENGYFSHQPQGTLRYHKDAETTINTQTSHFMRTAQTQAIEAARIALAGFQGLIPEEVAFTRNTTESLNIIIMGTQWQAGDEVIIGDQDYGSMVEAFHQAVARWFIRLKVAEVPVHPNSDTEIIRAYTSLITPARKCCTSRT